MAQLPRNLGDFILEEIIGHGGMGEVFRGFQKSLDRPVAIKLLREEYAKDSSFIARFQREAKSAAKLIHPNIIQVYQLGEQEGEYYFAMEYVEGKDLQIILRENNGKLPMKECLRIMYNVGKALEAANKHHIVHRDIKPSNVLLTEEGDVKVMDFGLAKALEGHETNVTISGSIMGTANYMSPEQAEGKEIDHRTDLYALGVMFYQLITGYLPFSGDNPTSLAFQHVHSPPIPPIEKVPGIAKGLSNICMRLMAKKKEERYNNATEFLQALQKEMNDSSTEYEFISSVSSSETIVSDSTPGRGQNGSTLNSGVSPVDQTLAPGMTAVTKVDTGFSSNGSTAVNKTVENTVLMGQDKTKIELQEYSSDSARVKPVVKKNSALPVIVAVVVVVVGLVVFMNRGEQPAVEPQENTNAKMSSLGKSNSGILPLKETALNAGNIVDVDLSELKSKLAKGFKVRLGSLDESNKALPLDNLQSVQRSSGNQKLELSHDFYLTSVYEVDVTGEGKLVLEEFKLPLLNKNKVIQSIDTYFHASLIGQLEAMRDFGFDDESLKIVNDRIGTLNLEESASETYAKKDRKSIIESFNLLSSKEKLSMQGNKLKNEILLEAKKDSKIKFNKETDELHEIKETTVVNSLGMIFQLIDAGEFMMGSSNNPNYTKRKVLITKPFAISRFEVTNKEYRLFKSQHNSTFHANKSLNDDNQPVVTVSWKDAVKFCEWLTEQEKDTGRTYRLPTEAEWEYCAKAGLDSDFSWSGGVENYKQQENLLDEVSAKTLDPRGDLKSFAGDDKFVVSSAVGSFKPNAFGLYDMHGNVKEWVNDYFAETVSIADGEKDPKGPGRSSMNVIRGACYSSATNVGFVTYREGKYSDQNSKEVGFRVVMEIKK